MVFRSKHTSPPSTNYCMVYDKGAVRRRCIHSVDLEGTAHTWPGNSFVDDTMMGATNNNVSSLPVACEQGLTEEEDKLVAKMETIIQLLLDCLQVTGGELAPSKCAWCLISHRWKDGIPRLL
jgi:hypothetical protein